MKNLKLYAGWFAKCLFLMLALWTFSELSYQVNQDGLTHVQFNVPDGVEIYVNDSPIVDKTAVVSTKKRYHILFKRKDTILKEIVDYSPSPNDKLEVK